jgi:hypothetical protein
MSIETETHHLACTAYSIRAKLAKPEMVVFCKIGPTGMETWQRIRAVRFNDGEHWKGLWVQEYGGLGAWQSPAGARFRRRRPDEPATA